MKAMLSHCKKGVLAAAATLKISSSFILLLLDIVSSQPLSTHLNGFINFHNKTVLRECFNSL